MNILEKILNAVLGNSSRPVPVPVPVKVKK